MPKPEPRPLRTLPERTFRARARNVRSGRVRKGRGSGFGMAGTSFSGQVYAPVCRGYD